MRVTLADTDRDLERAAEVLAELRTHLSPAEIVARIREQQRDGFRVAFAEADGWVLGVAGFVITRKLAWGKHMYVDDLVTTATRRGTGVGARLLDWLKEHAREQGCEQIHLDSGVQRFGAHRFYLRHGFDIASHHFSIADLRGDD